MNKLVRLFSVAALCVALTPITFAQDNCRGLATTAGPFPAECARSIDSDDVSLDRSGPMDTVFGFDAVNNFDAVQGPQFVRFAQDVPTTTLIGPTTAPAFVNAGDFAGNDLSTFFVIDFAGNALTVDAATGAETLLGNIGLIEVGDLAWDYSSGQFYAITSDCSTETSLYTVDFDALTTTLVGSTTEATCSVGLGISTGGVGYYHSIIEDAIYEADLADGSATLLGAAGFNGNFAQAADFDNDDGTLYLYAFNDDEFGAGNNPAELRTVDLTTGATTLVGKIGSAGTDVREITAGGSETMFDDGGGDPPFVIDANPESQTVTAPGTANFTYTVTNNTASAQSGVVFYQAFLGSNPVSPVVQVQSGSLNGMSSSPTLSFSVGVPGSAPAGLYTVAISAGPNTGTAVATDEVTVIIPASRAVAGGSTEWTLVDAQQWPALEAAARTSALGAFPNPFADRTEIGFELEASARVELVVYDVRGREVATLANDVLEAGQHSVEFDAASLPSGVYIYRLVTGTQVETGRMTLVK